MRLGMQDRLNKGGSGRTDGRGLAYQPWWRPVGIAAVRARHMLGDRGVPSAQRAADMAGDARAAVEEFHRLLCEPRLDRLAHQAGRHGIPMPVKLDVVVDARSAG